MLRTFFIISLILICLLFLQEKSHLKHFLSDSSMTHASVSLYVADAENGKTVLDYNSGKSLTPASVMKLITSAAAT